MGGDVVEVGPLVLELCERTIGSEKGRVRRKERGAPLQRAPPCVAQS